MLKMNKIIIGIVLFVLVACKTQHDALKTSITIPTKYEKSTASIQIDSVKQANSMQSWRTFFTDPLLVKLIDTALVSNFDVQIAFQRVQQARAGVQFTKGIRLPDFGVSIGSSVRRFGDYTIDGVGNYDTQFSTNLTPDQQLPNPVPDFYTGVYSTWEIDVWGKLKSKKKAALSRFLASEKGRHLVVTQLIATVAEHYYQLLLLDRELQIIQENITLQENALEIVEAQKESGKSNELAIELISAQVLNAKNMLLEVEQRMIEVENNLNFMLGRYPQTIARTSFTQSSEICTNVNAGIPSDILMNRPDIQSAAFELKANNADVHAAKVAFYPSININSNIGYQAFRASVLFDSPASIAYNLAGGLIAPVLNRRALKAELMNSKANQKQAYIQYEKTIVEAFTEVYTLLEKSKNFESMKTLKTNQVSILEKSISTSKALFTSGRASYLEIITSQENYLRSQIELLDIHARKTQNQVLLFKALGGGWE
jgi:outer membrane protein, multidrug efflux system